MNAGIALHSVGSTTVMRRDGEEYFRLGWTSDKKLKLEMTNRNTNKDGCLRPIKVEFDKGAITITESPLVSDSTKVQATLVLNDITRYLNEAKAQNMVQLLRRSGNLN